MVTTTNPTVMNQFEVGSNNYISLNFTDGGSEVAQWIVDFPADWNATGNVVFTPIWTAAEGTGGQGMNLTVKAKLFPDNTNINTALVAVGNSLDTLQTANYVHVGAATTGAAISGGSGNTAIIQVNRNSAAGDDTLAGTVQLIGLRVKYVTNKA
jgi:hypothetical protein